MSSHTAVSEAQLTDYLTWSGVHRDEYDVRFGRRAEARLTNAIASIRRLGRDDGLLDAIIGDLHADSLLWIMHAPELEYLLREARLVSVPATLSTFLFDSLRFELLLHSPSPPGADAAALWSARGELCLGPALRAKGPEAERPGSSRLALARAAACIGTGIPIDFDSPYNRGDLPNRFPVYASHASDERGIVLDKLRDAFALIETTGEAVTQFAVTFTQVIVPIRVDASGPWFGSFSSSWYPGRTVLVNAHLRDMLVYDVAAAIVHEAIHSLVDVSELEGRLLAPGRSNDGTVPSPWTGANISVQSLVDAYFVWYGLLHFWLAAARARPALSDVCDRYARICRTGFKPPLEDVMQQDLDVVHEFARQHIDAARQRVNALADSLSNESPPPKPF